MGRHGLQPVCWLFGFDRETKQPTFNHNRSIERCLQSHDAPKMMSHLAERKYSLMLADTVLVTDDEPEQLTNAPRKSVLCYSSFSVPTHEPTPSPMFLPGGSLQVR